MPPQECRSAFVGETEQGMVEDGRGIRYKAEVARGFISPISRPIFGN